MATRLNAPWIRRGQSVSHKIKAGSEITIEITIAFRKEQLQYAARLLSDSMGLQFPSQCCQASGGDLHGPVLPEDLRIDEDELLEVFGSVSLQRELDTEKEDFCGRFDEAAVAWDVARPWVDLRARDVARRGIGRGFTGIPHSSSFSVLIAHDVDRTTASEPFSILNSLLGTLRLRRGNWWSLATALSPRSLVRNIERLLEFERSQGIGAHYFMLSGPYGFGRNASRTDICWSSAREIGRLILQAGMPVGLHGSFAARERSGYREEKDRLEQALGCAVTTHRNHYLRFDPAALYSQLEIAAIRFDLSVGFVSRIGFRAGCARSHRAFDLQKRRPSSVFSVPQLFMDTVLPYRSPEEILVELRDALMHVKAVQGCVCLVFHPETFLIDSRAWPLFQNIVQMCRDIGADLSGKLPDRQTVLQKECAEPAS